MCFFFEEKNGKSLCTYNHEHIHWNEMKWMTTVMNDWECGVSVCVCVSDKKNEVQKTGGKIFQ